MNLILLLVLPIIAGVCGVKYNGLRVKFGWSNALQDKEYFFKIPRTVKEAEATPNEWARIERSTGPMPELRMYCTDTKYICVLYDVGGFVAGLQIGLPAKTYEAFGSKPESKMVKWEAPINDGKATQTYWTTTQYFVSEETLKAGAGPQAENGETLQDGGVWLQGFNKELIRVPISEVEINSTDFKKQNCIPNMGTHYYYKMTPELKCEDTLPWFVLTSGGVMVGTGFQVFGRLNAENTIFEHPPARAAQVTVPFAPPCLSEWAANYGVISLHIYYIDEPWNIRCSTGDSAKPAPALDRFILNGERYANKIYDELKNLFTG